ncbi:MAG: hypothetical protein ACM3XM_13105 [Mycobacterium leprae]
MSLFVTVASEMIVRQNGMGSFLFDSMDLGLYHITYATVLLIAVAGYALDYLFRLVARWALRWADSAEAFEGESE